MVWGKNLIVGIIFSLACLGFVFAASDTMHVNAQISPSSVGISVPNEVNFTNITCGYWKRQKIEINNTGNVDINVTPSLDPSYSGLFENLGFSKNSPGVESTTPPSGEKVGNYTFGIPKPEDYRGENSKPIYIYLDLTNYSNCSSTSEINESADVIFTAVEA